MDLRSNLSKARGLGSAHEGVHHWWMQRVSAIALIPLVIWFVVEVVHATAIHGIDGVVYLLASPLNAIVMVLFLGTAIYHGTLGIKVIIEDYVHCHFFSKLLDISSKFVAVASVVAVTFSILLVHVKTYDNIGKFQASFWRGKNVNPNPKVDDATDSPEHLEKYEAPSNKVAPLTDVETPKE